MGRAGSGAGASRRLPQRAAVVGQTGRFTVEDAGRSSAFSFPPVGKSSWGAGLDGVCLRACVRVHLQPSPICPNAGAGRLRACRGPGPHPPAAPQSPRSRAGLLTTGANVYKSAFSLSNPPAGRCLLFSSSNVSDLMRDGVSSILVCDQSSQNHEVSSTHGNTNLS